MPLKNATNHALALFVLICLSSYHAASFGVERPDGYGKKHSFDYYDQLFNEIKPDMPERHKALLDSCKEELRGRPKQCLQHKKLAQYCEQNLPIVTKNIDYCVDVSDQQLRISRDFTITFLFRESNQDDVFKQQLKDMFYSAVECTKAFYEHEGIELDITIKEVPSMVEHWKKRIQIKIVEYTSKGGAYHRISLANARGYHSHDKLCQLVSHELSHHFAIPDRYQRYFRGGACSKQKIYPANTLMAMNGENGYAGFPALRFHEHDLHNMLFHACPETVKRFMETSPDGQTEIMHSIEPEKKKKKTESSDVGGLIFFLVLIVSSIFSIVSRGSRKNRKDDEEVED